MENFNQIFIVVTKSESIRLNLNLLETGFINVLSLIGILIYTGKDFLGFLLEERKTNIIQSVQDAEDRLNEANRRLAEAQKQLNQYTVVTMEIQSQTVHSIKLLFKADAEVSKKDLKTRFSRALTTFRFKEQEIFLEVKQQIVLLVLKKTLFWARRNFSDKIETLVFNCKNIEKLEGDLL